MKANEKQKAICNSIIAQLNYWINNGFPSSSIFDIFNVIDIGLIEEASDNYTMNDFMDSMADIYSIIRKIK